jgi:hypothetical protein
LKTDLTDVAFGENRNTEKKIGISSEISIQMTLL